MKKQFTTKTERSTVSVDVTQKIVKKCVTQYADIVVQREVLWLRALEEYHRFPKLLDVVGNTITTSYCGSMITKTTCPKDWKEQMQEILTYLAEKQCSHNDIKPGEILVLDGKLMLVDFGWATKIGDPIPEQWPRKLGGDFRLGIHKFDDAFSFNRSVRFILAQ
jgi:serine/threonine protein kinase